MEITKSNVLVAIVLLGSIGHVMIIMNGYWNSVFFLTAIMVIGIPIVIHKFTTNKKTLKRRKMMAEI